MNPQTFKNNIDRVVLHFGEKQFSSEFKRLLWEETRMMWDRTFEKVCDVLICNYTKAPRVTEFMVEAHRLLDEERKKLEFANRHKQEKAFEEFWKNKNHPEDVKYRIHMITERMQGRLPDKEWKDFQRAMKELADKEEQEMKQSGLPQPCPKCGDGGWELINVPGCGIPDAKRCAHGN